jgi:hypothetical protein
VQEKRDKTPPVPICYIVAYPNPAAASHGMQMFLARRAMELANGMQEPTQ